MGKRTLSKVRYSATIQLVPSVPLTKKEWAEAAWRFENSVNSEKRELTLENGKKVTLYPRLWLEEPKGE